MNVICVIGDVIDSRGLKGRTLFQERFQQSLDEVNQSQSPGRISPCTITLGDEFQAVYRDAGPLFLDFMTILDRLYPAKIRFSVGIGPLETPINSQQALGMDGPAFHVARAAFDSDFKKSERLFQIGHHQKPVPAWVESGLALVSHEMRTWKRNRFQVFLKVLAGVEPKSIAEQLGITPAAVYKNLHAGALDPIRTMTQEAANWINQELQS